MEGHFPPLTRTQKMAFHFEREESAAEGVRRMLLEQVAHLDEDLRIAEDEEAIHAARKRCKQIRALLRFVRVKEKDLFRRENPVFRALANDLGAFRDADVRRQTFEELASLSQEGPEHFRSLGASLQASDSIRAASARDSLSAGRQTAAEATKRFADLDLSALNGFDLMKDGLHRTYKRGRHAMRDAYCFPKDTSFHEWRKRVKDLGYQLQLIRGCWPPVLKRLQKEIEDLGDLLGREHDLTVLAETIRKQSPGGAVEEFLRLLDQRARELQGIARALGERIYAERPKFFIGRLRAWWEVWKEEQPAELDPEHPGMLLP